MWYGMRMGIEYVAHQRDMGGLRRIARCDRNPMCGELVDQVATQPLESIVGGEKIQRARALIVAEEWTNKHCLGGDVNHFGQGLRNCCGERFNLRLGPT